MLGCAATLVAGAWAAQGQIVITSTDMFNLPGQYYRAYASSNTVDVTGVLGTTGGPQAWDFTTAPRDLTYRFDYLAAGNTPSGANFVAVGAQIAEQKTDEGNTNDPSWLYFTQDPAKGRLDFGFYDPAFSAGQPESVFTNALQDFPSAIHYGDTWSGATVFYSLYSLAGFGDFPDQLTYTSTDVVDAYGLVTLPNLGFLECLRVHELVQYDIGIDLGLGDGYMSAGTQFLLNYYWLAPGHGIVAQITSASPTDGSKPPDNMPGGAAAFVTMFETSHTTTTGTNPPTTIKGLKITPGKTAALLQWTALTGISSYRVEYATRLGATANWQTLGSTTSNFMLDTAIATPTAPARFYRVVGILIK
jgi:hypothetical protein